MTPRADALAVLIRQERAMDRERRAFAKRVADGVARNTTAGGTFDVVSYMRTSQAIEVVFDEFYGAWPNDTRARFLRLILDECQKARHLAVRRAIEDLRHRLPEPIWRAIRKEAAIGGANA